MLDLNLEVISSDSLSSCGDGKGTAMMTTTMKLMSVKHAEEDSGTSDSSVVNAEELNAADENSSNMDSSSLVFDVMKKEEAGEEIVTREFFPVDAGGGEEGGGGREEGAGLPARPQWLNLSFGEAGGELRILQQKQLLQQPPRKSRRGPRSRSSQYRGVTFYRRTGRWESHIWDCGKQVYLGGFDTAYVAARAYDRAAIKFRGVDADINFSISDYEEDMKQMANLTKDEFVHILRRQTTGFSREPSKYRGVTLQKCGRWDARMGQFLGKKPYDKVTLKFTGREAVTNFNPSVYEGEVMFNAGSKGSGHNLDLSLGMTLPASSSKGVESRKEYLQCLDSEKPTLQRDIPMFGCSSSMPKGGGIANFALPSKKGRPIWSAMCPAISPKHEVTVADKGFEAISSSSSSRFPNHRWQVPGNNAIGGASARYGVPLFASNINNNAASSGFSSSTAAPSPFLTTSSTSALPLNENGVHIPSACGYYTHRG